MTATTPRVPPTEITGLYGGLLKMAMRKVLGKVPESAEVMWHHKGVLTDMMRFGRRVEKWDELDRNLASLAVMATAAVIGCSFCLDYNYFLAHNRGLDESKARQVPRWRESDAFTSAERRVMAYAEAMSQTPPAVTDEMSAALLGDLGAPGLLELTARVGYMNVAARSNVVLGIHSEEFAAACGLPPLATRPTDVASPS